MGKRICPICGRVESEDAVYCRECGAKTVEDVQSSYGNGQGGQYSGSQNQAGSSFGKSPETDGQQQNSQYGNSQYSSSQYSGSQYNNYQDYTGGMSYQQPVDYGQEKQTNGLQIAGLVCGILAICSCCCYGVPAVILGIAGIICASMGNKTGKSGVGTGGFICSIIGLILGVISTVYYVWAIQYLADIGYWADFMDSL